MNEKEISEIRRRYRPTKNNISHVRGCYVNEKGEILSEFDQSMALLPEDETEKFLAILKRSLSGTLHKNLVEMEFSTAQVVNSEEHKLLMALRASALKDDEAVRAFFSRVIQSVQVEGGYLVLLAHDTYDVPYRAKDGERQDDASSEVYSYILCGVCPVKLAKPALSYYIHENEFHSRVADWIVSPPEVGFLFPAFDDRSANIYGALQYSRDAAESHEDFVQAVFGCEAPMPAAAQMETFQAALGDALADACSLEAVQAVHSRLQEMIEVHKANKEEEPLRVTKATVGRVLQASGVQEARVAAFEEQFEAGFGADAALSPQNLVNSKQIQLTMPDVTIQVAPGRDDLLETRIIDGARYILVRAEEGVEVNGVPIRI